MGLKPVSKSGPQHARGSARRTALHHEMLAIEKISRVASVERKRLEPGKRSEHRGRPLPAVAQHVMHAESAAARQKRVHRRRIPLTEIKIPETRIRRFITPRVEPLAAVLCSISGAVPLLFCRQQLPCPT